MATQSVFLFSGQGSQHVGMGKDLYQEFPEFAHTIEEASDVLNFDMAKLCFENPDAELDLTEFTQPAILTVSTGIFRVLQAHTNLRPHLVAGHSLGEYSALVALGALSFLDALKAVRFRGQAMQRAVPIGLGAMAAYLGSQSEQIDLLCKEISTSEERVEIANDNCPTQLVLSGHRTMVEKMCQLIAEKKLGRTRMLAVSAPFHSSLMLPAAEDMTHFLENIHLQDYKGSIVANVDAKIHTAKDYTMSMLIKQIARPVLWTQTLHCIHEYEKTNFNNELANSVWIEVGPGKVLQGLSKKTFENQNCLTTHDLAHVRAAIESTRILN